MSAETNFLTSGKKADGKLKTVTQNIHDMSDTDIKKMLSKVQSPLTVIDDVPIESEDVHIVYRVTKQTRFEAETETSQKKSDSTRLVFGL